MRRGAVASGVAGTGECVGASPRRHRSLHTIARRCDHQVIVAGVNVTGQTSCCLALVGDRWSRARAFDAADRPAPRLFLGTLSSNLNSGSVPQFMRRPTHGIDAAS